eukprot:6247646-Alexandrium_andersonii.AAC.1
MVDRSSSPKGRHQAATATLRGPDACQAWPSGVLRAERRTDGRRSIASPQALSPEGVDRLPPETSQSADLHPGGADIKLQMQP